VAGVIWKEMVTCLPMRKPGDSRKQCKEARVLRKAARFLRALISHVDDLVCKQTARYDRGLRAAAVNLARMGWGLDGWRQFTTEEWSEWGAGAMKILPQVEAGLADVLKRSESRMKQTMASRTWKQGVLPTATPRCPERQSGLGRGSRNWEEDLGL